MGKKIFLLNGSQFYGSDIQKTINAFFKLIGKDKTISLLQDKLTQVNSGIKQPI